MYFDLKVGEEVIEASRALGWTPIPQYVKGKNTDGWSRITVDVDKKLTQVNISSLQQERIIISIKPSNEKQFLAAASSNEIDLISLNMEERLNFNLKHSTCNLAIQKGIHFEVCYAQAIEDQNARRNIIQNLQQLIRATKGKNIIVSSGTNSHSMLRGTADVINLFKVFGFADKGKSKDCISKNCRNVLVHAESRMSFKGIISQRKRKNSDDGVLETKGKKVARG